MRTDLFDFELPPERIALRPVAPRDAARLLVVRPGGAPELEDRCVRELPDLLRPGDALVFNETSATAPITRPCSRARRARSRRRPPGCISRTRSWGACASAASVCIS